MPCPADPDPSAHRERRVTILGPGLLGGSIALALAERDCCDEVCVWGRRSTFIRSLSNRLFPGVTTTDLARALDGASLVILATPIGVMPDLARRIAEIGLESDCLVTDVGSVKRPVVDALTPLLAQTGLGFLGSHPMTGSEQVGIEAASPTLFRNAACIITPDPGNPESSTADRLQAFWSTLGARVLSMDPTRHDRLVARVSHLPHLVAALLVQQAVADENLGDLAAVAGPGFRDTTRVAAGDPAMWTDILLSNKASLIPLLEGLHEALGTTLEKLRQLDDVALRALLGRAADCRRERFRFPHSHA